MNGEPYVLLAVGILLVIIRTGYRIYQVGIKGWDVDDYLMPLAVGTYTTVTVLASMVGKKYGGLTNSYMADEERASIDPNSQEYEFRQMGSKIQVVGWSLYALELWLLKACLAFFYSRLTDRLGSLRIRVRIAYVLIAATYVVVFLTILFSCQPISRFWQISPDPGNLCQPTKSKAYVFVVLIPNIVTDSYLLSIPLPASLLSSLELGVASDNNRQLLWSVQIGIRQKASLILLFSGAVFIIVAGTIRAVVILSAGPNGAVAGSAWACRENFVALIVTNLPVIQPLIRRCAQRVGLSGLFSRTEPTDRTSAPLGSEDHSRAFKLSSKKKTGKSSLATQQQTTAWGSNEHILAPEDANIAKQRNIIVNHEFSVTSEESSSESATPHGRSQSRSQWN